MTFRVPLVLCLALSVPMTGYGASRARRVVPIRPAAMTAQTGGELSVDFFPLPDSPQLLSSDGVGVLNLGTVSYVSRPQLRGVNIERQDSSFDVSATLGMRVGTENVPGETVILKAWLTAPAQPYRIFLDNVELSRQPVCVDAQMLSGVTTRHELRVRVPRDASQEQSKFEAVISMQAVMN